MPARTLTPAVSRGSGRGAPLSLRSPAVRRVLVIAYFFPPLGGAGVQRTLKFVKYLPQFGWRATVVSTRSGLYGARDPELVREIPEGTRVVRAPAVPVARWLAIALYKLGLRRLMPWVSWPDGGYGWAPVAFVAAWRQVRRQRPDVILSTSSPYGAHLVGLMLHRLTGIPWVADFRDEWAANPHLADQPRALARLSARAEAAITRHADHVVVAADYFALAGDAGLAGRRTTVTNGVDADDVPADHDGAPPTDRFRLSFVGTLYGPIDLHPVLAALERLITEDVIDPERFELRVVGSIWIPDFAAPDGVPVTQTGYLDHEQAIAEMRSASALVLFVPESSLAPSGTIFEYLAVERPIICVTREDNLAAQLVREWNAGSVARPSDLDANVAALQTLYRRWEAGDLEPPAGTRERVFARYSRRELTRQLATVLETAAEAGR
jgi:glycosyltransferase involved in cell wall biosynthesis